MDLDDEIWELRFHIARSIRYHDKKRAWFDVLNKVAQIIALVASSAAVINLIKEEANDEFALWFSAIAATATLVNLVMGSAAKFFTYSELKKRFVELDSKLDKLTASPTEAGIVALWQEIKAVEKDEPPISKILNIRAHNAAVDALGAGADQKRKWHVTDLFHAP